MKRLKDNIMLIILTLTIIICTICICNKIDNARWDITWRIDTLNQHIPSYDLVREIHGDTQQIMNDTSDIMVDVKYIRQDVDDIGYHFGI